MGSSVGVLSWGFSTVDENIYFKTPVSVWVNTCVSGRRKRNPDVPGVVDSINGRREMSFSVDV